MGLKHLVNDFWKFVKVQTDQLNFNPTAVAPTVFEEGTHYYDPTLKTVALMVNGDVILPVGQEEMVLCYNNTGSIIANGQVVYPTGAYGGFPTIALAMADTNTTSLLIGVTTQAIAINGTGFVTNRGTVRRVDTSGYVAGDTLYLSTSTPGGLTKIPTVDPTKRLVRVAVAMDISATVGSIYVRYVLNNRVSDMSDVLLDPVAAGDALIWNGLTWINQSPSQVSAGAGVNFYLDDTATIDGYGTLSRTPITTTEVLDSVVCNNNTVFCEGYLHNFPQNRTQWDAGTWKFNIWAYVSASASVSEIITAVHMVEYYGGYGGTVEVTGSGTSRTATVTGTTPFAVSDANADQVLASYLQTAGGTFQITAHTSSSVVTIATPSGYGNESGVVFSVQHYKFQVTTGEINQLAAPALYIATTVQPVYASVSLNTTIATRTYGKTASTSNKTLYYTHNGDAHYTYIETPFMQRHNDLPNEQGGSSTERYHLMAAQYAQFAANSFTVGDGLTGSKQLIFNGANDGTFSWDSATQTWTLSTGHVILEGVTSTGATGTGKFVFDTAPTFATSITTPSVLATANDSGALGASGTAFADLFLAAGGVINWNAGNATLTHSTGLLTSNVPFSLGTSNALTCGSIELGAAADTTITRTGAGAIAVEGVAVLTSAATGIQTFLTTPSSANLLAAVTDETGTGALVFATAPQFDTTIGIGRAANSTIGIWVAGTLNSAAYNFGHILEATFAGTTLSVGFYAGANIAAATAVTDFNGVLLGDLNLGAGATVTNQYQLWIDTPTKGGTINQAIHVVGGVSYFGGAVGIKKVPGYDLELNADSAGKPGLGGLWTVVSDERIKKDIVSADLNLCYDNIKNLPLKYFGWVDGVYTEEQVQDRHGLGWIAQDVKKIFPKAVSEKPFVKFAGNKNFTTLYPPACVPPEETITDCLDLNSGQLIASLYGAVQQLMVKVERLEEALAKYEETPK
jgi:hypothetical protein